MHEHLVAERYAVHEHLVAERYAVHEHLVAERYAVHEHLVAERYAVHEHLVAMSEEINMRTCNKCKVIYYYMQYATNKCLCTQELQKPAQANAERP